MLLKNVPPPKADAEKKPSVLPRLSVEGGDLIVRLPLSEVDTAFRASSSGKDTGINTIPVTMEADGTRYNFRFGWIGIKAI